VGLLSIGEEDAKGNEITKTAFRLLERSGLNFVGNAESRDLFENNVDVAVCDGFVGNVVLKTSESVAKAMAAWVREEITARPIYRLGALLCHGAFMRIKAKSDPAVYGGAPLLGVNGVCIIGHGSSTAQAVANGIRVACESVDHEINPQIIAKIKKLETDNG
jgi:glycerol-3-phosphate acyltransferase PlsX